MLNVQGTPRSKLETLVTSSVRASPLNPPKHHTTQTNPTSSHPPAQKYNVPTYQLALVNSPAVDAGCTNIQPGQELCLGWKSMDCSTTHTVIMGDTCLGITSQYNIQLSTLYTNNPQVDADTCNNIYVGEVLCVAAQEFSYPWVQLPSSAPSSISKNSNGGGATASSSGNNAPTAGSPTVAPSASSTATATATASANDSGVEYCDEDDTSEDCVDEDDLPYCDEQ